MNRNTAAARLAAKAAVRLNHYTNWKNAKNALPELIYPYTRRRITYNVYAWPSPGTNWREARVAQHKIRQVLRNINTNNKYVKKTPGNTVHPPMWKNKNVVNKAMNNYFNTHVIPELLRASSPSLKNLAKKSLEATRRTRAVSRAATNQWKYITGRSAEIRRALANYAENKGLPRKNNARPLSTVRVPSSSPRRRRTPMFTNAAVEAAYRRRHGIPLNN